MALRRLVGASRRLSAGRTGAFPTVDVGGLLPGAADARRAESERALVSALLAPDAPGFFYCANAPAELDAAYLARIYAFVARAHALPPSVKAPFAAADAGSGELGVAYNGADVGHPEPSYDGVTVATARAWDYSPHGVLRAGEGWDAELPADFASEFAELYARQNALGNAVLGGIARVLGVEADAFSRSFDRGDLGTIRLIDYPGSDDDAVADADVGISPHTDFEAFTLMHQDAPGLQLLERGDAGRGAWRDAPVTDDFVVIVGDVLERYTNGVLKATPHRVVRTKNPRRSIIRFNAVAPDEVVAPLPDFVGADGPRYTPVTMQEHMDTTLGNLRIGIPSWDPSTNTSRSATYVYGDAP